MTDQPIVRVVIADDHPVVREGLTGMLEAAGGFEVVGQAADGQAALDLVRAFGCDVVLMDLRMPVLDGANATAAIRALPHPPHVLVLTTFDTDSDIVRAVEAGATGYLLKDTPRDELIAAVRAASRGETVLAPPVAVRLVRHVQHPRPTLTARERDVLGAVYQGRSNAQIAAELGVSEATVKTHLVRIYAKLDVPDRTRAVTVALERGLLSP